MTKNYDKNIGTVRISLITILLEVGQTHKSLTMSNESITETTVWANMAYPRVLQDARGVRCDDLATLNINTHV